MLKDVSGDSKPDAKPEIVTGTVELIVTSELREKIALKRLKRQKIRMLGDESSTAERAEIDLGDLGA